MRERSRTNLTRRPLPVRSEQKGHSRPHSFTLALPTGSSQSHVHAEPRPSERSHIEFARSPCHRTRSPSRHHCPHAVTKVNLPSIASGRDVPFFETVSVSDASKRETAVGLRRVSSSALVRTGRQSGSTCWPRDCKDAVVTRVVGSRVAKRLSPVCKEKASMHRRMVCHRPSRSLIMMTFRWPSG